MSRKSRIFITSDTHFAHYNIIEYCNRPFSQKRHDDKLVNLWNAVVGKQDIVYHLGDFGFKNKEYLRNIVNRLNGMKYLIIGNHDIRNNINQNTIGNNIIILGKYHFIRYGGYNFILIHDPAELTNYIDARYITFFNDIVLCGHAHQYWKIRTNNKWYHRIRSLFTDNIYPPLVINMSVDVWKYRPVKLDDVISYLKKN